MKKKKAGAQPATFKNNPFKTLKGIAPPQATVPKAPPRVQPAQASSPEEDDELFRRAVSGARKIADEEAPFSEKPAMKQAEPMAAAVLPEDSNLFLQAMKTIGTNIKVPAPAPDEEDREHRSSSSRMKQLKRGTIRISSELDLHGYLKDEALTRLAHFIASAFSSGQQAVLVITGKGINSPEGPVLQGAVAEWLHSKGRAMAAEFSPAPRNLGGSGAFVVFLKKR